MDVEGTHITKKMLSSQMFIKLVGKKWVNQKMHLGKNKALFEEYIPLYLLLTLLVK